MEEGLVTVASVSEELDSLEHRLQALFPLLHEPSILAALPPLHRAAAFLSLSKALNALFALHLRCRGLPPKDQLSNSELERVSLYDSKVGHFIDDLKGPHPFPWLFLISQVALSQETVVSTPKNGPRHRTTVLNVEAANRFIEHAIPDLTEEQKKDLQGIKRQCVESKQGSRKPKNLLKKPLQPARTQSITEAAAAFLEETKKDFLEEQEGDQAGE